MALSPASYLSRYGMRPTLFSKLAAAGQFIVFDVEPDTLYRGVMKARSSVDDTLVAQVAPTAGSWATGSSYSYQQQVARASSVTAGSASFTALPICGLDASSAWSVLVEFMFFSGSASELPHLLNLAGGAQADGSTSIFFNETVYNTAVAVAQVRFGIGTPGALMAGSRAFLEKIG